MASKHTYQSVPPPHYQQHQAQAYPQQHNQYTTQNHRAADMGAASAIIVVLITIVFPPAGAFLVAGCGVDLLINILLTCLGYIPGHLHAFYLEYIYYRNREAAMTGQVVQRAPGVYSKRVQTGGGRLGGMNTSGGGGYGNGNGYGYDNVGAGAPPQQGYGTQGGYGTVPQDGGRY